MRRAARLVLAVYVLALLACLLPACLLLAGVAHAAPATTALPAAAPYRAELVRAAHSQWGLSAPVALFAAQVHQESAWRPQALSHVGAAGLAQFMPATARWLCARSGTAQADCTPTNPVWALRALVSYNRFLYERLVVAGDPPTRWWATLRGYNGGLGHWQAEARAAGSHAQRAVDGACGLARRHVSHCAENLNYPQRIMVVLQPRYQTWGPAIEPPPGVTRAGGAP